MSKKSPVVGRTLDRVGAEPWDGQQPALEPRLLRGADPRLAKQLLGHLGAFAFHRVTDRPLEQLAGDRVLHQVVLGADAECVRAVAFLAAGQHDHGNAGRGVDHPAHRVETLGVGKPQVEQNAADLFGFEQVQCLGEGPRPEDRAVRHAGLGKAGLHQHRVAVIVFYEQDRGIRDSLRGRLTDDAHPHSLVA